MSKTPDAHYADFDIYVIVLPGDHGGFTATADVEYRDANGMEVIQHFAGPCDSLHAEAARQAVLDEARRKIDDMNASPIVDSAD